MVILNQPLLEVIRQFLNITPQTYGGDLMIHAAFANTEYKFKN
jgi:hypothetical protein